MSRSILRQKIFENIMRYEFDLETTLKTLRAKVAAGLHFPRKRSVTDVLPCTFQPFTTKLVRQSQISRGRVFASTEETQTPRHPSAAQGAPIKETKHTNAERQTQQHPRLARPLRPMAMLKTLNIAPTSKRSNGLAFVERLLKNKTGPVSKLGCSFDTERWST
ncbi:hypothetical protein J6590_031961 [Homalodisca vitripennis]|nr:hypothetical protein J6590_031961 [Homalodisca vitripennis]